MLSLHHWLKIYCGFAGPGKKRNCVINTFMRRVVITNCTFKDAHICLKITGSEQRKEEWL